ncbi:MAG: type II toxin-antitoxin system HicB family antitoxin [Bacillota bacterium]|nr:type II toxin-antitoxin system HicB family antitoxin [Bacillota bacterium]
MLIKYPFVVQQLEQNDGSKAWFAAVIDLPGCIAVGDTFEEMLDLLEDAIQEYLMALRDSGQAEPEPSSAEEYSDEILRLSMQSETRETLFPAPGGRVIAANPRITQHPAVVRPSITAESKARFRHKGDGTCNKDKP